MLLCRNIELPSEVFTSRILPLLDRRSFNHLSAVSKDFYAVMGKILPPWPERLVAKNHLCCLKSFAFSSHGMLIACGCSDGRIRLWNLQSGEQKPLDGHWPDEPVHSVVFARRSEGLLASASEDHTILIWKLVATNPGSRRKRTILSPLEEPRKIHSSNVSCLRFSHDDSMIIVAHQLSETIKFWNVSTGELVRSLSGPLAGINTMEISNDGKTLVASSYGDDSSTSSCLRVWNLEDGSFATRRGGLHNVVAEIRDPERCGADFLVASVYQSDSFNVWSTDARKSIKRQKTPSEGLGHSFRNAYPHEIAFSFDGSRVASVDEFGVIKLWNVQDGSLLSTFHDESAISLHAVSICTSPRMVGIIPSTRIGAISRKQNLLRIFQVNHYHGEQNSTLPRY